jgi:hypothetical protein
MSVMDAKFDGQIKHAFERTNGVTNHRHGEIEGDIVWMDLFIGKQVDRMSGHSVETAVLNDINIPSKYQRRGLFKHVVSVLLQECIHAQIEILTIDCIRNPVVYKHILKAYPSSIFISPLNIASINIYTGASDLLKSPKIVSNNMATSVMNAQVIDMCSTAINSYLSEKLLQDHVAPYITTYLNRFVQ